MDSLAIIPKDLEKLETYEDYIQTLINLSEASENISWYRSDIFVSFAKKFGKESLVALARDLKQPHSTLVSYIRTAKAFPPEKRVATLTFSAHFQASLIDSFDGENFAEEKRYSLIEKAADEHMSTREIAERVKKVREKDPAKKEAEAQLNRIFAFLRGLYKEEKYDELQEVYTALGI